MELPRRIFEKGTNNSYPENFLVSRKDDPISFNFETIFEDLQHHKEIFSILVHYGTYLIHADPFTNDIWVYDIMKLNNYNITEKTTNENEKESIELHTKLVGHKKYIGCYGSLDSNHFASVSEDKTCRIWSIQRKECTKIISFTYRYVVKYTLFQNRLLLLPMKREKKNQEDESFYEFVFYDWKEDEVVKRIPLGSHKVFWSVQVDERKLITYFRKKVVLWEVILGEKDELIENMVRVKEFQIQNTTYQGILFSFREKQRYLGIAMDSIGCVNLHNFETGKLELSLREKTSENDRCFNIFRIHSFIASCDGDGKIRIWRVGVCEEDCSKSENILEDSNSSSNKLKPILVKVYNFKSLNFSYLHSIDLDSKYNMYCTTGYYPKILKIRDLFIDCNLRSEEIERSRSDKFKRIEYFCDNLVKNNNKEYLKVRLVNLDIVLSKNLIRRMKIGNKNLNFREIQELEEIKLQSLYLSVEQSVISKFICGVNFSEVFPSKSKKKEEEIDWMSDKIFNYFAFFYNLGMVDYCYVICRSIKSNILDVWELCRLLKRSVRYFEENGDNDEVPLSQKIINILKKEYKTHYKFGKTLRTYLIEENLIDRVESSIEVSLKEMVYGERYPSFCPKTFTQIFERNVLMMFSDKKITGDLRLKSLSEIKEDKENLSKKGIVVHKEIILLNSNFFHMMVKFDGKEKDEMEKDNCITLSFFDKCLLNSLVRYIYTNEIPEDPEINFGNLIRLLSHADQFFEFEFSSYLMSRIIKYCLENFRDDSKQFVDEIIVKWLDDINKLPLHLKQKLFDFFLMFVDDEKYLSTFVKT